MGTGRQEETAHKPLELTPQMVKCLKGEHEVEDILEGVWGAYKSEPVCIGVCTHCACLYILRQTPLERKMNTVRDRAKLVDEKGVEDARGVPVSKLRRHRLEGSGPEYLKLGRLVRYELKAIDAWLESCRVVTKG